jgi:protein-tyrosine phosphatase
MQRQIGLAGQWRGAGAYLQVNYGSLAGRYGSEAQAVAFRLLREGWVDYLASDFHGHPTLKIYRKEAWTVFEERHAGPIADVLCRANPARMIADLEPVPVPPVETDINFLARLRGLLRRVNA